MAVDRLAREEARDAKKLASMLRTGISKADPEMREFRALVRQACASGGGVADARRLIEYVERSVLEVQRELYQMISDHQMMAVDDAEDQFKADLASHYVDPPQHFRPIVYGCPQMKKGSTRPLPDGSDIRVLLATLPLQFRMNAEAQARTLVARCASLEDIRKTFTLLVAGVAWRARTMLRHESRRQYREQFMCLVNKNEHLVKGWIWVAKLDKTTCVICWAMHGTQHPRSQGMDAHVNCRCRMVPVFRTYKELGFDAEGPRTESYTPGDEVLRKQSKATQQKVLGADYEAWSSGQIQLSDMVGRHKSKRWGYSRFRQKAVSKVERVLNAIFKKPNEADRKRLSIPPAWKNVQVAKDENAALQATGVDAKGRKQSIYSAAHHEEKAAEKYARISVLHERLPEIDKRLSRDAKKDDTALAALLIRRMGLRPGSDSDTGAEKKAHGATNLKASHVTTTRDGKVRARFTGKKGVALDLEKHDPELARLLNGRKRGKGDDRLLDTNERKLREYMARIAPGVKPKDLRTYLGTSTAMEIVASMPIPTTEKEYKASRREVAVQVSKLLGNTPTIALASYIAPAVFAPWDS